MDDRTQVSRDRDPLIITDESSGKSFYGGDQDWYKSNTRAYAGCGSVACANMLRVLACKYPDLFKEDKVEERLKALTRENIYKTDFIGFMSDIYSSMLVFETPLVRRLYDICSRRSKLFRKFLRPSFGMSLNGFIRGCLKYSRNNGLILHAHSLPTVFCSYEKGLKFIKEGLDKGGSVIMLTSLNKHPVRLYSSEPGELEGGYDSSTGISSHFMTITDIIEDKEKKPILKITTWGRVATIPYDKLHRSWQKRRAYTSCLYYFTPAGSEAVVRADIRNSTLVLLKALAHALFGRKNYEKRA